MLRYESEWLSDTIAKIELFPSSVLSWRDSNCKDSIQLFLQQLTLQGVRHKANCGMTFHTSWSQSASFSCNCNSMIYLLSSDYLRCQLHFSHPLLQLCKYQCNFHSVSKFQLVQQSLQYSTRINSSNVHTYMYTHSKHIQYQGGHIPAEMKFPVLDTFFCVLFLCKK